MTRDDVIRMANGARGQITSKWLDIDVASLERFANLVAAAEREECAKVCEGHIGGAVASNEWWNGFKAAMKQCAAAIRARS